MIVLAGGGVFFFEEFDFGNELPGTPQKAVGCAPPPLPPKNIFWGFYGNLWFPGLS